MAEQAQAAVEHNLHEIAFPSLDADQVARLKNGAGASLKILQAFIARRQ